MIRADTPPGTEVVCVDASPGRFGPVALDPGAVYTVDKIVIGLENVPCALLADAPGAVGYEVPYGLVHIGYNLCRFRYLELPASLTALLHGAPLQRAREYDHNLVG